MPVGSISQAIKLVSAGSYSKTSYTYYFAPQMPSYAVGVTLAGSMTPAGTTYVYAAGDHFDVTAHSSAESAVGRAMTQMNGIANLSYSYLNSPNADINIFGNSAAFTIGSVTPAGLVHPQGTPGQLEYDLVITQAGTGSPDLESVILHELLHTAGLLDVTPEGAPPIFTGDENTPQYTAMAYGNHATQNRRATELQLYDVAALQSIYGRDDGHQSTATTYDSFIETRGGYAGQNRFFAIWDGGGTDEVDASALSEAALIDLRPGHFSSIGQTSRVLVTAGETPTLTNPGILNISIAFGAYIENATGSDLGDLIIGNLLSNKLEGGAGDDVIYAEGESAIHEPGHGDYQRVTNTGDTRTESAPEAVQAFVDDPTKQRDKLFGGAGDDYLHGGRGNDIVAGGDGDDTITGGPGNDTLTGGAGSDRLDGGPGSDVMMGDGRDELRGGAGHDYLIANKNCDHLVLIGGAGNDVIDALGSGGGTVVRFGRGDGHDMIIGDLARDPISGMISVSFFGIDTIDLSSLSKGDVTFVWDVDYNDENFREFTGNLAIRINDTGDTLLLKNVTGIHSYDHTNLVQEQHADPNSSPFWGRIHLNIPTIIFADGELDNTRWRNNDLSGAAPVVSLTVGDVAQYATALDDFQNAIADDAEQGTSGDDDLSGSSGGDDIAAGGGDDSIQASAGNDRIDGGDGIDTVNVFGRLDDFSIARNIDGLLVLTDNSGFEGVTRISNVEFVYSASDDATYAIADLMAKASFIGTDGDDSLLGTASDDTIFGYDGDDSLSGLAGDDRLAGGAGDDRIEGGEGFDTAVFSGDREGSRVINLGAGQFRVSGWDGIDVLAGIERLEFGNGTFALPTSFFAQSNLMTATFGVLPEAGGWSDANVYPRTLADINGDGRDDLVGFGIEGAYVSLAAGGGEFSNTYLAASDFGSAPEAGGWSDARNFPRMLGDVNGDGCEDLVGFGNAGVYVALADADGGFGHMSLVNTTFGSAPEAGGWSDPTAFTRTVADVNGDGLADLVGFGNAGVYVALADGSGGFGDIYLAATGFGAAPEAGGWSNDQHVRTLADVNGDGCDDLVGFGDAGVYVALADADGGFGDMVLASADFGAAPGAGGWSDPERYPRMLADVNGDGLADLVGFGDAGTYLALAAGDGGFGEMTLAASAFGLAPEAGGWASNGLHPRALADVNGDGLVDIIGFGNQGVHVALASDIAIV